MKTSLAAVFSGVPGSMELKELPRPEPAGGELLVHVLGCTLCGSDLHTFEGRRQAPVPTVLGHEIVGEIVALGESVPRHDMAGQTLNLGDRVTWSLVASCGHCFFCRHSLPQKCLQAVKYGHEAFQPGRELLGGLAEHCLIVPGTSLVRLPNELPLEVACPANCATATAAAAVEAAGDLKGSCVCVLGAGLLGLTVCAMASVWGAREVICVEVNADRREQARAFGATHPILPEELANVVARLTEGRGVDVAFELTGSPAAFTTAWPALRIGGTFVVVGSVFPSPPVELPLEQLVRRHLAIRGIHNYQPHHLLTAVQFLTAHHLRIPFTDLVSQMYPLADISVAFAAARHPSAIRVGVGTATPA
jgi:putative phosphonate catabolism associated alcohol dehydrogenase